MNSKLREKIKRQIIAAHLPSTDVVTRSGSVDVADKDDNSK